ncbi:MAG: hypothetical protein IPK26_20940 [Planctomycetes bacterium]|nr:hypothetical protein [Planctomycetota bacterium]
MPAAKAAEVLAKAELPGALALPVTKEQVLALRRSGRETGGPTSGRFPHATWMIFGSGMPFVKNWRQCRCAAATTTWWCPGSAIHDGVEFELQDVPMPDDRIGWVMSAKVAIVDWDSPTRSVRIGEQDFAIDEAGRARGHAAGGAEHGPAGAVLVRSAARRRRDAAGLHAEMKGGLEQRRGGGPLPSARGPPSAADGV